MIVTIKNGRACLYNDRGSLQKTVSNSGAVAAAISEDGEWILVVYDSGKAELRKGNGSLMHTIVPKDAVGGTINSSQMALQMSNGRTQVRKVPSGSLIRTI